MYFKLLTASHPKVDSVFKWQFIFHKILVYSVTVYLNVCKTGSLVYIIVLSLLFIEADLDFRSSLSFSKEIWLLCLTETQRVLKADARERDLLLYFYLIILIFKFQISYSSIEAEVFNSSIHAKYTLNSCRHKYYFEKVLVSTFPVSPKPICKRVL